MGILDDAIRQHLDLKRRQGAADDELKRLEDEAFGPPSRPGDPDFPESEAAGSDGAEALAVEGVAVEERPAEAEPPDVEGEEPVEAERAPASDWDSEDEAEPAFFDQGEEELDLELELDDEDEVTPAPPSAAEPPIESLDTAEHPYEGAIGEPEQVEEAKEHADEEEHADEGEVLEGELTDEDAGREDLADDEDDVLEETPEFLRDAPEDDELWFEQGRPKDFDF
jgi:hypothetical protein